MEPCTAGAGLCAATPPQCLSHKGFSGVSASIPHAGSPFFKPGLWMQQRSVCDAGLLPYLARVSRPVYGDYLTLRYFRIPLQDSQGSCIPEPVRKPPCLKCAVPTALHLLLAGAVSGMNSGVESGIRPMAFCIIFEGKEASPCRAIKSEFQFTSCAGLLVCAQVL